jgi:hypothetical protein
MVINIDPNHGVSLPAGTVPGLMHVYCVNTTATFGISIYNPPPPWIWHQLSAGHMLTFQVDRFAVWVFNNGPSRIQLLYPDFLLEGKSIGEVEGAIPINRAD